MVIEWCLDTRNLLLCMPETKFVVYGKKVKKILNQKRAGGNGKALESIIGKFVIPSYAVFHVTTLIICASG